MNWDSMTMEQKHAYGAQYLQWLKDSIGASIEIRTTARMSSLFWDVNVTIAIENGPGVVISADHSFLHLAVHEIRSRIDPILELYGYQLSD